MCTCLSMCLIPLASFLISRCSTLILQPCGTPDPLLPQPQGRGKKWDPGPWEEAGFGKGRVGDDEVPGTEGSAGGWGEVGIPSLLLPLSLAGPWSLSPGLDLCLLRAAAATGGSRGSCGAERFVSDISPDSFWPLQSCLDLPAPPLWPTR